MVKNGLVDGLKVAFSVYKKNLLAKKLALIVNCPFKNFSTFLVVKIKHLQFLNLLIRIKNHFEKREGFFLSQLKKQKC